MGRRWVRFTALTAGASFLLLRGAVRSRVLRDHTGAQDDAETGACLLIEGLAALVDKAPRARAAEVREGYATAFDRGRETVTVKATCERCRRRLAFGEVVMWGSECGVLCSGCMGGVEA